MAIWWIAKTSRGWQSLSLEKVFYAVGKTKSLWHGVLCNKVAVAHAGAKSTKGLHVCRHLHRAGWRVVLVDVERCEGGS